MRKLLIGVLCCITVLSSACDVEEGFAESVDDDSAGEETGGLCPNPEEQAMIPGGVYELVGYGVDDSNIVPQVRPNGEYSLDASCIETCRFPGCGAEQIGQHDVSGDGLTYRMVAFIADQAPEQIGRRLCTGAEHQAASALPDNLAYGYGSEYFSGACDSSLNPTYPLGALDTCVSALGVRDVTQRGDWVIVDEQTSEMYNQWSLDHGWTYLGPESEGQQALIESGWLAVSGGVNDRCSEASYGCFVNSLHWHVYAGDPFSYENPDVEYDDDSLRFCLDINGPPTSEQESLYMQIQEQARMEVSYEPLLTALGWYNQPTSVPTSTTGRHY